MKHFLVLLFLSLPIVAATPTLEQQQTRLYKVLRKTQRKYDALTNVYIVLNVKRAPDMKHKMDWGAEYTNPETGAQEVEILAAQDYPRTFTPRDIRRHQDRVVLHECLHMLLSVSDDQDVLIEALWPGLKKP